MQLKKYFHSEKFYLIIILILAALVRFGGLTWCFPYTPHPDEYNMATAITRLNWSGKFNPFFYAYGQFPLYLAYFSAILYNKIFFWAKISEININEAVFFLRFWSATAGVGTVYLVYLITKNLFSQKSLITNYLLLVTPLLAAFTPGLIQISHFGTTESLLSFFFLLIIIFCFKIIEIPRLAATCVDAGAGQAKIKYFIFLGIIFGLAIGTKISALIFGFPILSVFLIQFTGTLKRKNKIKNIGILISKNLVLLVLLILLVLLSSPYLVLAFKESRGTLLYETSVAAGKSAVFYTRQFIDTKPILFQLQKIFPYSLGWPIFILGTIGFFLSLIFLTLPKSHKYALITNCQLLITVLSFLTYFLSQAFLYTKWTRFMSPVFAFFPIFAGIFLQKILSILHSKTLITNCQLLITSLAILPGIIFSSIYFLPNIRFTASNWMFKNIPDGSQILHDTGNVVDIPIAYPNTPNLPARHASQLAGVAGRPNFPRISFDFYHLDENPVLFPQLLKYLETSDYIILPSRRIFVNHLRFPKKYPLTAKYYELLFSGKLGFVEVARIEPLYSKIFNDEKAEETFSVFDHPTIRIYKKKINYSRSDYENLFKQ